MQILDELIIAGELQESSKKSVLRVVRAIQSDIHFPIPSLAECRSHKRIASRSRRTARILWHGWAVSDREDHRVRLFIFVHTVSRILYSSGWMLRVRYECCGVSPIYKNAVVEQT